LKFQVDKNVSENEKKEEKKGNGVNKGNESGGNTLTLNVFFSAFVRESKGVGGA
jgi:hypothetical protein